jgi:aryl-alcohol dehydrogenase-like predicted oxidoreductase
MTLPTRALGKDGPQITTVGFGAWAVGGGGWSFGWGPQDDDASIAAMHRALELGINWIDTAAVYGLGHSERVVGRLLEELPANDRPFIFTKGGQVWDEDNPMVNPKPTLKQESVRRECENSLRRLGVETIDLYQYHWPSDDTPFEESWGTMAQLIEEGKVRWGGVSNYTVSQLDRCEAVRHVDSLQPPFSLIRRKAAADVIPWCAEHGTGVICYSPMQAGLLTDRFTTERMGTIAKDDWRHRSPEFHPPAIDRNLALRDTLRPTAQRHGVTVASVASACTLEWPGMTGAIVGARSPEQVDGWIDAATLELNDHDLEEIAHSIKATGAGEGPVRPMER